MDAPVIKANASDSAPSQTSVPSRSQFAGGIGAIATYVVVLIAGRYGVALPDYVQLAIPIVVYGAVAYVVPPTVKDVANRLNDSIVALAAADPDIPVSDHTMVLPEGTKVVAASVPAAVVATPPAMGPPPVVKTDTAQAQMPSR